MNINATLLGQMFTFALFVWFTMKFVWPPVIAAIEQRQQTMADGLAAAERGQHELKRAKELVHTEMQGAHTQAHKFIEQARKKAEEIIATAKLHGQDEYQRIVNAAQAEVEREREQVRKELMQTYAETVKLAATKILQDNLDSAMQGKLFTDLVSKL